MESYQTMWDDSSTSLSETIKARKWSTVQSRILANPLEAIFIDRSARTSLHILCAIYDYDDEEPEGKEALKTAKMLIDCTLEKGMELLFTRDDFGENPMHLLCGRGHSSPSLIQLLLDSTDHPGKLISAPNYRGCTPLHFISEGRASFDSISRMLRHSTAETLLLRDEDGDTPLHFACSAGGPIPLIAKILHHCPKAVLVPNHDNQLPLEDFYFWYRDQLDMLQDDGITNVPPRFDFLPTSSHNQTYDSECTDILHTFYIGTQLLLRAVHPNQQNIATPLHAAAATPFRMFTIYLTTYFQPKSLFQKDENGMYPLHHAASAPQHEDLHLKLVFLISHFLQSVRCMSRQQKYPFHYALITKKPISILKLLLIPEILSEKEHASKLYPFMLAAVEENNSLDVVFELLLMNPELVRVE